MNPFELQRSEGPIPPWTPALTEAWLNEFPLPVSFSWQDRYGKERNPMPTYRLRGGYGKWLRETPYFPGLFEEVHAILQNAPEDRILTPEWVAEQLSKHQTAKEPQLV